MSYDINFPCAHCATEPEENRGNNPTYNLSPIFNRALGHPLRQLSGKTGSDTILPLNRALTNLRDPSLQSEFRALEPPNGWGDLDGAIRVIQRMLDVARKYPNNVWEIQ